MDGESSVRAQRATIELLRRHEAIGSDVGTLAAAASAQCDVLDETAIESLQAGWVASSYRSTPELDADLIVSTTGLFYVVPKAAYVWWRPWPLVKVEAGRASKLPFGRAELIATADNEQFVFRVRPRAAVAELVRAAVSFEA